MHGELLRLVLFVGCLVREWELQFRMLLRPWHCAVSVFVDGDGNIENGGCGPARSMYGEMRCRDISLFVLYKHSCLEPKGGEIDLLLDV